MENWEKCVKCYNSIGENFRYQGEYDDANQLLNQAQETGVNKLGEKHPEVARTYDGFGNVFVDKGSR
jgi:hypothetical protein